MSEDCPDCNRLSYTNRDKSITPDTWFSDALRAAMQKASAEKASELMNRYVVDYFLNPTIPEITSTQDKEDTE